MISGPATATSPVEDQGELLAHPLLADELTEMTRAQRGIDEAVLGIGPGIDNGLGSGSGSAEIVGHARAPPSSRSASRRRIPTSGPSPETVMASASPAIASTASSAS